MDKRVSFQTEKAASAADEIHFLGDFNINLLSDETQSRNWSHSLEAFDFSQLVKEPIRVTAHSATLIDRVYTNQPDKITECFVPKLRWAITIRCALLGIHHDCSPKREITQSNIDHLRFLIILHFWRTLTQKLKNLNAHNLIQIWMSQHGMRCSCKFSINTYRLKKNALSGPRNSHG